MAITVRHYDDSQEFRRDLFPVPSSVRLGRDLAEVHLNKWGLAAMADNVALIVSELLTNAIAASRGMVTMRLLMDSETLTIEVTDASPSRPRRKRATANDIGGRGLQIIEFLAESWGDRPSPDGGKVVWARCPLP
ncbi:ATP-binding protein [Spirillospora sp. NPDC048819]|uniref:ATP-binding protein n=1 Tax=Spirillospora sp. NPDC048819 TaxID=3155268 RepID=UPI0033E1D49B